MKRSGLVSSRLTRTFRLTRTTLKHSHTHHLDFAVGQTGLGWGMGMRAALCWGGAGGVRSAGRTSAGTTTRVAMLRPLLVKRSCAIYVCKIHAAVCCCCGYALPRHFHSLVATNTLLFRNSKPSPFRLLAPSFVLTLRFVLTVPFF